VQWACDHGDVRRAGQELAQLTTSAPAVRASCGQRRIDLP
jgi:hypothetical protein